MPSPEDVLKRFLECKAHLGNNDRHLAIYEKIESDPEFIKALIAWFEYYLFEVKPLNLEIEPEAWVKAVAHQEYLRSLLLRLLDLDDENYEAGVLGDIAFYFYWMAWLTDWELHDPSLL